MELNSLGRRIQVLRESNMMTRGDLAQEMGITRKELVDWEEGRKAPTAEQIVELGRYFDTDPRSLVDEADQTVQPEPERASMGSGKRLAAGLVMLTVGVFVLLVGVGLMQVLAGPALPASSAVEEAAPLPEYLALTEVELKEWDLDGDGKAELVNPQEAEVLLIREGKAYALAEPLAGEQRLTVQDGVFIVKDAAGESRIYSRLREDGIYPAG